MRLDTVERIETVSARQIEFAGGRMLLQYRGELLTIEDGGGVLDHGGDLTVLICRRDAGRREGVVVSRVLDVAEGSWMGGEMAIVQDRVMVVHGGSLPMEALRRVA